MADEYNASDLASVLRTLSALAPNRVPASAILQSTEQRHNQQQHEGEEENKRPRTIDPSGITTWPAALRYVMSTMAQNQGLQGKIRRLIQSQHDHEKQWWAGREALLKKQGARAEKKQQLDEVLRSVGAPIDNKVITTPEEDRAEVARYDAKVYKASVQMAEALHTELRALQMPFFAINRHLVVSEASKDDGNKLLNADTQGTVTQDELSALQRRILELLQDICKE